MIRMKRAKLDKKGKGKDTTESKKPTASMQMLDLFVDKVTNQKVYPWIVNLDHSRINMGVPVNFDAAYRHLMNLDVTTKPEYVPSDNLAQRAVVCLVSAGLSISERLSHLPEEIQELVTKELDKKRDKFFYKPEGGFFKGVYSGINFYNLVGKEGSYWLTFNNAKQYGAHVLAGSKSQNLWCYNSSEEDDTTTGKRSRSFQYATTRHVFNETQVSGGRFDKMLDDMKEKWQLLFPLTKFDFLEQVTRIGIFLRCTFTLPTDLSNALVWTEVDGRQRAETFLAKFAHWYTSSLVRPEDLPGNLAPIFREVFVTLVLRSLREVPLYTEERLSISGLKGLLQELSTQKDGHKLLNKTLKLANSLHEFVIYRFEREYNPLYWITHQETKLIKAPDEEEVIVTTLPRETVLCIDYEQVD